MQKLYTVGCSILLSACVHAQTVLQVNAGTELYIRSGTAFYAGGLVLQPSADYTLQDNELSRHTSVAHFTASNYAARVLRFANQAPAFSGSFRFYYADDELNSIPENRLALNVHNDSYWQALTTSLRNATDKYIVTNAVGSLALSEFALSDELTVLPLIWGSLQAVRQGPDVQVRWSTLQENLVAHFLVERSTDGVNWQVISDIIAAHNQAEQDYQLIDKQAPLQRLHYRIRQQDINGAAHYSTSVTVAGVGERNMLQLYPNPAQQSFRLLMTHTSPVQKIELYSSTGALLQRWQQAQAAYDISRLASGSYHVIVHWRNGETEQLKFQKN